jgi:TPP-dependent pyruvate/acetoin dehydrogenase alpha subunit
MMQSRDELIALYRTMVRIRLCEEALVGPILAGEIKTPCHLYSGQEAIATGICACLTADDYVFGSHRSHGHFLAKGGSMVALLAEILCREDGCSRGRGGSMHLIDVEHGMLGAAPIVAETISLALGAALASAIRAERRVTVAFFGDGATGEGLLYESLNFAALRRLPVVFACENNLYATHLPLRECRPTADIYRMAEPLGVTGRAVAGNDVLAVREAARAAVEQCRAGQGPVFLELKTYRLRGHVGPDDNVQGTHTDIRPDAEVVEWRARDPIVGFERFLSSCAGISEEHLTAVRDDAEREVAAALDTARKSPRPRPEDLTAYVYS